MVVECITAAVVGNVVVRMPMSTITNGHGHGSNLGLHSIRNQTDMPPRRI